MAELEAPRDTILRVLYEKGGFVPLKSGYNEEDTKREFGLNKVVFDTAFMELWKVEKAVQPLKENKENSQEAGLSLNTQKNFPHSLASSLGEASDVIRNNTKKNELI